MSIDPRNFTDDLLGWFSIFLPFKNQVHADLNDELLVNIERFSKKKKVWYEWSYIIMN